MDQIHTLEQIGKMNLPEKFPSRNEPARIAAPLNYFVKVEGKEQGPLTAERIRRLMEQFEYRGTDLVRCEGSEEWKQLASTVEFRDAAAIPNPMAEGSLILGIISVPLLMFTVVF